jgi:hypothetical protein
LQRVISLILVTFLAGNLSAQDTLPKFTLAETGQRVTISWINPYQTLSQLNIQRSYDSLKGFSTIYSAMSPQLPQNGFTEVRPATSRVFYRIFYAMPGGSYFFSKSQRAAGTNYSASATASGAKNNYALRDLTNPSLANVIPGDKRLIAIRVRDTNRQISINAFRSFRDSVLRLTKDTLYSINDSIVGIRPYGWVDAFKTSAYIYINKDGYINVSLPSVNQKKYHLKFFEEDGTSLFEISNVIESPLILDKANFVHSGWFQFELYEDNKLKEKNKLYVPKDF